MSVSEKELHRYDVHTGDNADDGDESDYHAWKVPLELNPLVL